MSPAAALFPASPIQPGQGFTGRDLLRQWFKYWTTITLTTVAVTAVTLYGVGRQPDLYVAEAKVWIKTDQQGSPSFLSGVAAYREGQLPDPANRKIETEMQLLLSRSSIEAVVRRLGIRPDQFPNAPLSYLFNGRQAAKSASPEQQFKAAVELFAKSIKVEPARSKTADTSSNMLEIQLETTDAALAPRALNALVEQYQNFGSELTRQQGQATYALISQKMKQARVELSDLEKRILVLNATQGGQIELSGLAEAPTGILRMDGGLRMDAELGSARVGGASAIALIKSQAVSQEGHLEELRQLYTDESELVRNAKRQLAQTQARLNRRVKAGAEQEAQLRQLERARVVAQDRFVELLRKLDQIELYLNSAQDESSTRIFTDRAQAPDRPENKKKLILSIVGPLAGLALGLLFAGIREYFDHRLQSVQDVARYLGLETLGVVPEMSGGQS